MTVELEPVVEADDDFRCLVEELDRALAGPYAEDQHHALSIEELFSPHVTMFVVRLDGDTVGCGGVAIYEDFAEVKRMYTRPQARGRGIAGALLQRIEACAREANVKWLRLETGIYQTQAMALYERSGFSRCPAFGPYREKSPHTIELSVFYEKSL